MTQCSAMKLRFLAIKDTCQSLSFGDFKGGNKVLGRDDVSRQGNVCELFHQSLIYFNLKDYEL